MPTMSPIPLFGLTHKVNIVRYGALAETVNAAGSIERGAAPSVIYTNLRTRWTLQNEMDSQMIPGLDAGQKWKVITKYAPLVQQADIAIVANSNITAPPGDYVILFVKHQQDHNGKWHHTTIWAELQEGGTPT